MNLKKKKQKLALLTKSKYGNISSLSTVFSVWLHPGAERRGG
jgi:hypothetical protein